MRIQVNLNQDLLEIIDLKRGELNRSEYINQILQNFFSDVENHSEDINKEDEEKIKILAKDPFIHTKIIRSISPSLYGMEMEKFATALSLFGGVRKVQGSGDDIKDDIHVLFISDPGTGVNEMIKTASKLTPKILVTDVKPKMGRYDDDLTINENINIKPTILSNFDLIFIVRDKPDEKMDKLIADHILKRHMPHDKLTSGEEVIEAPIEAGFLKKYIQYARTKCESQMTAEASAKIKEFYIKMRKAQGDKERPNPIGTCTLEGLIRLSEAHAKMALRKEVLAQDVEAIIKVQEESMKQVSWDAERQQFDVDGLQRGTSHSKRERLTKLYSMIKNLQEEGHDEPVDLHSIVERAGFAPLNLKEDEVMTLVEQLKRDAMIVERKGKKYLVVKDAR